MSLILPVRQTISDTLRRRSIARHRSRIGWRVAPRYSRYLKRAQSAYRKQPPISDETISQAVETFRTDGAATFLTGKSTDIAHQMFARITAREAAGEKLWAEDNQERGQHNYTGDLWHDFPEVEGLFHDNLGAFLQNYFQSEFKILHGVLYQSVGREDPRVGSQRWHSDSGPGICVNVMFYLHETTTEGGTLQMLPWHVSESIYDDEPREIRRRLAAEPGSDRRVVMADYYDERISERHSADIRESAGPAGMIVPFLNNTLHRGGYPSVGLKRTAIVFHCYPSHRPTDFARYARDGIGKTIPYPQNPADDF